MMMGRNQRGSHQALAVTLFAATFAVHMSTVVAIPLQWERLQPGGEGPGPRHGHATATFEGAQGLVFLFGGYVGGDVTNELWAYNPSAHGWEKVQTVTDSCGPKTPTPKPTARAAHTFTSCGNYGLVCGGYNLSSPVEQGADVHLTKYEVIRGSQPGNELDCWWFTPVPTPTWTAVRFEAAGREAPAARHTHSVAFDCDARAAILYGGAGASVPLKDAWMLQLSEGGNTSSQFAWTKLQTSGVEPSPRMGHGSVVYRGEVYIVAGATFTQGTVQPTNEVWRLSNYLDPAVRAWEQVWAVNPPPPSRSFHSTWLIDFQLFIHGGQGLAGLGTASVLDDTWVLNLFTLEWTRQLSSAFSPAVSFTTVSPTGGAAMLFGGKMYDSTLGGQLFRFHLVHGWTRDRTAGLRPAARMGHVAALQGGSKLVIAFGVDAYGGSLMDTWVMDLGSREWRCVYGPEHACTAQLPAPPHSPGGLRFPASVATGSELYVFGGVSAGNTSDIPCFDPGRRRDTIEWQNTDVWSLSLSSLVWRKLIPDSENILPLWRIHASLAILGPTDNAKQGLVLVAGARTAGITGLRTVLDDVWLLDVAAAEHNTSANDKDMVLDGVDDVLSVPLPDWCHAATSMSVLWIEMWINLKSAASGSILVDAHATETLSILRWSFSALDPGLYLLLELRPDTVQTLVKAWGPLDPAVIGSWHHVALTLRTARHRPRSGVVRNVITQAFAFLDGSPLPLDPDYDFGAIILASELSFEYGISELYMGCPPLASRGYVCLHAAIDNFRVWWPPCPHLDDPSKCNPYAFLYPILPDGSRLPRAVRATGERIHDHEVLLADVALPVKEHMFTNLVPMDTEGLLVQLRFNVQKRAELVDESTWGGITDCSCYVCASASSSRRMCAGCESGCSFDNCVNFDGDCTADAMWEPAALSQLAREGVCDCTELSQCPKQVQECTCPPELYRRCRICLNELAWVCVGTGDPVLEGQQCGPDDCFGKCLELEASSCPPGACQEWECGCSPPPMWNESSSGTGQAGVPSVVAGVATCSCPLGTVAASELPLCDGSNDGACAEAHACCDTNKVACFEWSDDGGGHSRCLHALLLDGTQECGHNDCCVTSAAVAPSQSLEAGSGTDDTGQLGDPASCGDGIVQPENEQCDEGPAGGGLLGSCEVDCKCDINRFQFDNRTGLCECIERELEQVSAEESSSELGSKNDLTLWLKIRGATFGLQTQPSGEPMFLMPLVVVIGGLRQATPLHNGSRLPVSCVIEKGGNPDAAEDCAVGVVAGSPVQFTSGVGAWSSGEGTLRFTVASSRREEDVLKVKFGMRNDPAARTPVRPQVSVCGSSMAANSYVLGSGLLAVEGNAPHELVLRKSVHRQPVVVGSMHVPADALGGLRMHVQLFDTSIDHGVMLEARERIPVGYELSGLHQTGVEILLFGGNRTVIPIDVGLLVDSGVRRRGGGCSTQDGVTLCAPGYAGVFAYDRTQKEWKALSDLEWESRSVTHLNISVSTAIVMAVFVVPPCSNGQAQTEELCRDVQLALEPHTPGLLGKGTATRAPALSPSTRPRFSSLEDFMENRRSSVGRRVRSAWRRFCPAGRLAVNGTCPQVSGPVSTWIWPRYGHATVASSRSTMLLYGGTGCAAVTSSGACLEFGSALNELWEWNLLEAEAGIGGFRKIEAGSGRLSALEGPSLVAGGSDRLLLLGGVSTVSGVLGLFISQEAIPAFDEPFTGRDYRYRQQKIVDQTFSFVNAMFFHQTATNGTHAVMFGGLVGNSLSNAVFTYSLAVSESLSALQPVVAAAVAPPRRAWPGVARPDASSLLLHGGVSRGSALQDLVVLDLRSEQWSEFDRSSTIDDEFATAFDAFDFYFYTGNFLVVVSSGGLVGGYASGTSFRSTSASRSMAPGDQKHQVTNFTKMGLVLRGGEFGTSFDTKMVRWLMMKASNAGTDACCAGSRDCEASRVGVGCMPSPRAMHTLDSGKFRAARASLVSLGGVGPQGQVLGDMYILDTDSSNPYFTFDVVLMVDSGQPSQETADSMVAIIHACEGMNYLGVSTDAFEIIQVSTAMLGITARMQVPYPAWPCVQRLWDEREFLLQLEGISPELQGLRVIGEMPIATPLEAQGVTLEAFQLQSNSACRSGCVRGLCSNGDGQTELVRGQVRFCFGDQPQCSPGFSCSVSGLRRHGHSTVPAILSGSIQTLFIFGGETTDVFAENPVLSSDLSIALFIQRRVDVARLPVTSSSGARCLYDGDCPAPRRDAALTVMGNSEDDNGYLILFGGMVEGGIRHHLDGEDKARGSDELWFAHLRDLREECITLRACPGVSVRWTKLDVPGERPTPRWGAGVIVNPSAEELLVAGGATYLESEMAHRELDDLHVFYLTDAFHKKCTATGPALFSSVAGVPARFGIRCLDSFDRLTSKAVLRVEIAGPVTIHVAPFPTTVGHFVCEYTAVQTGAYTITILVGREEIYQEEIAGLDLDPSNDVHELVVGEQRAEKGRYQMVVDPGETAATNSLAKGDGLSLATAGVVSTLRITTRDVFGNRRPGGDAFSVLFESLQVDQRNPRSTFQTASVTDASDGSYTATYRLTRAGSYSLSISLASSVLDGTPFAMAVMSGLADISRTFVYGKLGEVNAGVSTSVFVQTRDAFGNPIFVDPAKDPSGREIIEFLLCIPHADLNKTTTLRCAGGVQEYDVGITQTYGKSPEGGREVAWGLHEISFFPYKDGEYFMQVRHNDTPVECYFDMSETEALRPSTDVADLCSMRSETSVRRGLRALPYLQAVVRRDQHDAEPSVDANVNEERDPRMLGILRTFHPPDTIFYERLLWVVPMSSLICGVLIDLICYGRARRAQRNRKEELVGLMKEYALTAGKEAALKKEGIRGNKRTSFANVIHEVQAKKLRAELAKLQGREQDIADEDAREPAEQRAVSVPAGVVAVRVQPRASSRRMPGAEPPSVQQSNMPVMLVWEDGAAGALGQAGPEAVEKWAHLQLQATADEELQLDLSSEAGLA